MYIYEVWIFFIINSYKDNLLILDLFLSHQAMNMFIWYSRASQVGRQLARIGDDINRRYADEFKDMINQLNVNEDTAYEVFAGVAKK